MKTHHRRSGSQTTIEPLESRVLMSGYSITKLADLNSKTDTVGTQTPLLFDASGNLFGTTTYGGDTENGSIFEIPAGTHAVNIIASLDGNTGYDVVGLAIDSAGDVFVAANRTNGAFGSVLELKAGTSALTPVTGFTSGSLGALPVAMTIDPDGNLYLLTSAGGEFGSGAILKIAASDSSITRLASLDAGYAGDATPNSLVYVNGNLYGTTLAGGATADGTVFELPAGATDVSLLGTFTSATTGSQITGAPYVDSAGNVFGVATRGGVNDTGDIWEIPAGSATINVLKFFDAGVASNPAGRLIADSSGELFGVTQSSAVGFGAVYEFSQSSDQITVLATFDGSNGLDATQGLTADASGNFFGVTSTGGSFFNGTVFEASTSPISIPSAGTLTPTVVKSTLAASVITAAKSKTRATVSVTNGGTARSTGNDTIALFATPTAGGSTVSIGSVTKSLKLQPGKATKVSFALDTTSLPAGNYVIAAQTTDSAGAVTDSSATTTLTVTDPFVSLTAALSAAAPATVKPGKSTNITLTLTNAGNVDSVGPATIAAGLSLQLGTVSMPLTTLTRSVKIKAGGKPVRIKLHLTTPTTLSAGTYNTYARLTQGTATASTVGANSFTVG